MPQTALQLTEGSKARVAAETCLAASPVTSMLRMTGDSLAAFQHVVQPRGRRPVGRIVSQGPGRCNYAVPDVPVERLFGYDVNLDSEEILQVFLEFDVVEKGSGPLPLWRPGRGARRSHREFIHPVKNGRAGKERAGR